MKKMKKFASLALALVLALALAIPAFAEGTNSITVSNAEKGATYTLYKIFDAKVIDGREDGANGITYSLPAGITEMPTQLSGVFELDAQNGTISAKTDVTGAQIMAAVKAYAVATPSAQVGQPVVNQGGGAVVFSGLEDGYYAVISNVSEGNMVTITSIAPNATVSEKNTSNVDPDPKNSTKTLVDENGNTLTDKSVSIGDTIYYMVKTTAVNWVDKDNDTTNGAEFKITEYTVKDLGADFLTGLKIDSINVVDSEGNKTPVTGFEEDATVYTIPWVTDWKANMTDEEIAAAQHLYTSGVEIQVMYSATVNANILNTENATNQGFIVPNGYDDPTGPDIPHEDVYTYGFGLVKTTTDNTVLNGAEFELYDGNGEDANKIEVVAVAGEENTYRVAQADETGVAIQAGNVVIKGLANGTYYLKETKAPDGYNAIVGFTDGVTINGVDNLATVEDGVWTTGGIHVVNNTGAVLPSTGGIGTTIFYIGGGILVAGAAILLITKKRMGAAE